MKDKNGVEIKQGDTIIHTSFPRESTVVKLVNGVLMGGEVSLSGYHSSVLEVIKK